MAASRANKFLFSLWVNCYIFELKALMLCLYLNIKVWCAVCLWRRSMWWCSIVVPVAAPVARRATSAAPTSHFYAWRSSLTLIGGFFVLGKRHFFVWRGCSPLYSSTFSCLVSLPSFISELIVDQKGWRWPAGRSRTKSKEIGEVHSTCVVCKDDFSPKKGTYFLRTNKSSRS